MKNSESLYELIHSLTKNEKRYFKMYCSGLSSRDGSNYLLLFGALEKQKQYDAEALKRALKKPSLVKNLSAEKNYLFNLILESLLVYHKDHPEYKIRMMMSKAQLLYEKSLVKPGFKLLMAAKKLAQTYEHKSLMLDILQLQRAYSLNAGDALAMQEEVKEVQQLVDEVANLNRYQWLLTQLLLSHENNAYARGPEQRKQMDEVMKDELLQDESKALTLVAKITFNHTWSYYFHLIKERGRVIGFNKRILELLETNPEYTSLSLNNYLSVLFNFITDAIGMRSREDILFVMQKLEDFPRVFHQYISPVVRKNYEQLYMDSSVRVNAVSGEFEKTLSLLPDLKAMLEEGRMLKRHRRYNIALYTAYALFASGKYKEALRWLQEFADIPDLAFGAHVYYTQGMFLRLMIHYELDNGDVLEQQSALFRQFLLKEKKLYRTEDELLNFFAGLASVSQREREQMFAKTMQLLDALEKDEYEFPILSALRFVASWIKSKVEGRDLAAIVKEEFTDNTMQAR